MQIAFILGLRLALFFLCTLVGYALGDEYNGDGTVNVKNLVLTFMLLRRVLRIGRFLNEKLKDWVCGEER